MTSNLRIDQPAAQPTGRERGAVLFLLAATVLVVLLCAALAVDLAISSNRGQRLQNAADAAALAGVQAYRASDGNQAIATEAVEAMLAQNGIDITGSTGYQVTFPDDGNDTEVQVELFDSDPGTLLSGITGRDSNVGRSATARFESCQADCTVNVVIPSPFRSVNAAGTGDGYKPIPVGNQLYALNHNSSYGGIVCIDRATADDPDIEGICNGWTGVSKPAYSGGAYSQTNPEMPHSAVVGSTIYWTASNNSGTWLYCFETLTATPCAAAVPVNNRARATSSDISNRKDHNRGGGTVLAGGNVYVFTDDHRVHCFRGNAGFGLIRCAGYEGNGKQSFLGLDGFPTNEPEDGNHGSSIDRIVDDVNGKLYWTLHVPSGPAGAADCSSDNQQVPEGLVSIKNAWSGLYVERDGGNIRNAADNEDEDTHWWAIPQGTDGSGRPIVAFRSATNDERWIDSDSGDGADLDVSSSGSPSSDDRFTIDYLGTASTIRSYYGTYVTDTGSAFETVNGTQGQQSNWIIQHPDCFDPGYVPPVNAAVLEHRSGTWLQCWDYVNAEPCNGFVPSAIHTDGSRFSGRLFFSMTGGANPLVQGVCSTGFQSFVSTSNFEVNCVDEFSGALDTTLTSAMTPFRNAIASVTDDSPAAWGDPHYNRNSNRVLYPSAHDRSRVVCWDFDFGMCGVEEQISSLGPIEDYGYFSEGDCVYGLGHNARFYAFQAEDIFSECTGSSTRTRIEPCDCSGNWAWGTITFDVDLVEFDEFLIQVRDASGDLVYPTPDPLIPGDNPQHSLHDDGITIDLNGLPINEADPENDFLEILVSVNAENDPWASGEQSFTVEFGRAPRLID